MERLTKKDPCGLWITTECDEHYDEQPDGTCKVFCCGEAIDRLAAYEGTGLEPGEVMQIKLALMGKVLAEIKEFEGIHADRMIELAQAEKDGRLVVLPCKVGDFVFDIADGTCYATQVLSFTICDGMIACRTVSSYPMVSDFGSRVFLTRQEAEAALREADENA